MASQYNLPSISELTALPPPVSPPSIQELLLGTVGDRSASPSSKPSGFYEELMQSRPEALYQDARSAPGKYEEGVTELLEQLVASRREPTAEERARLDAAVLSYHERPAPPAPKPKTTPVHTQVLSEADEALGERAEGDEPAPGPETTATLPTDETGQNPFWWL